MRRKQNDGEGEKKRDMCRKKDLPFFSVDTVAPVYEVWSSGSHQGTMRTDVWQREDRKHLGLR